MDGWLDSLADWRMQYFACLGFLVGYVSDPEAGE